jgi:hypothetical protein
MKELEEITRIQKRNLFENRQIKILKNKNKEVSNFFLVYQAIWNL